MRSEIETFKQKFHEILGRCMAEAKNKDIVIEQNLELKQFGQKNTASQGNIEINIVQQEIMIGLMELQGLLAGLEDAFKSQEKEIEMVRDDAEKYRIRSVSAGAQQLIEYNPEKMRLRDYLEKITHRIVVQEYDDDPGSPSKIARRLGVSPGTVIKHVRRAYGDSAIPKPGWPPGPRRVKT